MIRILSVSALLLLVLPLHTQEEALHGTWKGAYVDST